MAEYKVIYDSMTAGIRTVKLEIDGFLIDILHSPKMKKDIHITFEQPDVFGPKIDYVNAEFILTYNYITIPEKFQAEFKDSYDKTLQFCSIVKPVLETLITKIRNGGQPL